MAWHRGSGCTWTSTTFGPPLRIRVGSWSIPTPSREEKSWLTTRFARKLRAADAASGRHRPRPVPGRAGDRCRGAPALVVYPARILAIVPPRRDGVARGDCVTSYRLAMRPPPVSFPQRQAPTPQIGAPHPLWPCVEFSDTIRARKKSQHRSRRKGPPRPAPSPEPAVARRLVDRRDGRAISRCVALGARVTPARVARTVASEPLAHHLGLDVHAVEVADATQRSYVRLPISSHRTALPSAISRSASVAASPLSLSLD